MNRLDRGRVSFFHWLSDRKNGRVPDTGSLLIVTLWLVTILSVLAVAIGRFLSTEVRLTKYRVGREQARVLARSGVYLALQRLADDAKTSEEGGGQYDWLGDDWAQFPDSEDPAVWAVDLPEQPGPSGPGARIEIRMVDEERKLPLNRVQSDAGNLWYKTLGRLVTAPEAAPRIADYLDANTDPFGAEGLEVDEGAQPPYAAKNGPLVAPEELLAIPGLEAEPFALLYRLASVAPLSVPDKLNINTVSPEVLAAMGMREGTAESLRACRASGTIFKTEAEIVPTAQESCGIVLDDDEQTLLQNQFGVTSHLFTVNATGRLLNPPIEARVEALVQRSANETEPPKILAWRES